MTMEECDALVSYVESLPAPIVLAKGPSGSIPVEEGRRIFAGIGCADCHTPDLGPVKGLYSDLLIHDMGASLDDPGTYDGSVDSPGAARPEEWRTPPLWGVRDSGPYLHDGRAHTLDDVDSWHGGQGHASALQFKALDFREKSHLIAFLNTLAAPAPDELADDALEGQPHRGKPTTANHNRP